MNDWVEKTAGQIRQAIAEKRILTIRGGGSKHFYGHQAQGEVLDSTGYSGIIEYQPSELTLTVRAGTPLAEIEQVLAANGQILPFEPPHFGAATLGGCVASGLSGPRRPYSGAVRDAVLGVTMLDGKAQWLKFGGQVIKNVAGYDVSRMVVGSLGTLGVLAEICVRVLPRPECERTLLMEMVQDQAITAMNAYAGQSLPLSAMAWEKGHLLVRLSGAESAVEAAMKKLGGDPVKHGAEFWQALKEQTLPEFSSTQPLWRVSLPSNAPVLQSGETALVEWGGALRWVPGNVAIRDEAVRLGGHATLFRTPEAERQQVFTPLSAPMAALQQRIRQVFDPHGVFDAGRLGL